MANCLYRAVLVVMLSLLGFYWFLHMLMLHCLPWSKVDSVVLNFDLLCSFTFYAFLLFKSPPKTNLGRVRFGYFGIRIYSGIYSGFAFRLFCSQEQKSWNGNPGIPE